MENCSDRAAGEQLDARGKKERLKNRLSLPFSLAEISPMKTRALLGAWEQANALFLPSPRTEAQDQTRLWRCARTGEHVKARRGSSSRVQKCSERVISNAISHSASKKKN